MREKKHDIARDLGHLFCLPLLCLSLVSFALYCISSSLLRRCDMGWIGGMITGGHSIEAVGWMMG